MKRLLKSTSGSLTLLMVSNSFAHPGHTTQLIHGHENLTLGIAGMVVAGIVVAGAYLFNQRINQRRAARLKAAEKAGYNKEQ